MLNITLRHDGTRFIARCAFEDRKVLQDAGFRFDESARKFYTSNYRVASLLRDYADEETKKEIYKVILHVTPWEGSLPHSKNLKPTYYQPLATKFALSRNRSYLGVAAGLGKTIMAALASNAWISKSDCKIVYVCPSFLTRNVENEFSIWSPHIEIEHFDQPQLFGNMLLVPDSLFTRRDIHEEIARFLSTNPLQNRILFVDEAHRFKNDESDRTRILLGHRTKAGKETPALVDLFDNVVYMSGSPMPNRPLELYPILSKSAPETIDFATRDEFGLRYCAGRYNGFGYDFSGASNLRDLATRVQGTFMFRLRKEALRLPPLLEECLVISEDMPSELSRFEHAVLKAHSPEDLMKGKIEKEFEYENIHLMTYQRLLGLKKVAATVEFLEAELAATDDNFLVFARHKDVVAALAEKLKRFRPLIITGDVSADKRFDIVNKFQKDPDRRIMLGNLRAMGLGFNITKANRVINVEPDWTPDSNDQGRDRAHRMGQENSVLVQYVVHRNSIDEKVMDVVLRKRKLGSYV